MISASDLIHLPYSRNLTEGGIAYALHSLPYTINRIAASPYDRLRRIVAGTAVELAFRRYLSDHEIPYDVKGAAPFTEPERYDVALGGRRCDITSFLITHRAQITEIRRNPKVLLNAPALVPSDQYIGGGSHLDLYLFAFLPALVASSQDDLQKLIEAKQDHYLVHVMPEAWSRPVQWQPLGKLVLKSEAEEPITLEIGGQDERREMRSCTVELSPRTRFEVDSGFFSLSHVHAKTKPTARIGIHSAARKETYLIAALDWGNIWLYGNEILLTGYVGREEFGRCASFIQTGSRVFQYEHTHVKNLAMPVSELQPLPDLFERVKAWNA